MGVSAKMIRKVCIVDGPIYVMVISDLLLLTSFPNLTNPIHLASGLRGHPSQSVGLLGGWVVQTSIVLGQFTMMMVLVKRLHLLLSS